MPFYKKREKLDLNCKVYITEECKDLLRMEKNKQRISMAKIVCNLIKKEYMRSYCDICEKSVSITSTINCKINKDGLIILCKKCWAGKGFKRDRLKGQIQENYYLAN